MQSVEGSTVIAVASATPGKAIAFAKEKNIPNAYDSYEKMLQNPEIDCIYICTTHNFHYENLLTCIQYKKHIICEKPFVLHKWQASEIFEKAKQAHIFVMEAMWSRFTPAISKAKAWIQEGKIGTVKLANYAIGFKSGTDPEHRLLNPSLAGGVLYDLGVYPIEVITFLVGQKLQDVTSMILPDDFGRVDGTDCIILKFSDSLATLNCTIASSVVQHCNIYGTEGRIYIENPHSVNFCTLYNNDGSTETFHTPLENGFEYQIMHMVEQIKNNRQESDIMPYKDTIECAEIFDKVFEQNKGILP